MANPNSDGQVGLGIIGVGGFGAGMAEKIHQSEKLRLLACYDISAEMAEKAAEKYGCVAASSLEELVSQAEIEGVVVVTPNFAHREHVVAAARAGKHVFVDKPIANEIEDAYAMIDACGEAGVFLAVGHNFRRFGSQRKLKELIDEGVPGTIVAVEANFSHAGGMGLTPQQWRYYADKAPALPLIQLGVHCADTLQHVVGPIAEVSSFMGHAAIPADNLDVTATLLRFENGTIGYLGSNYATPAVHYVNIYGTKANLYSGFGSQLRVLRSDRTEEVIHGPNVDDRLEELEDFGECIRMGKRPEVDGEVGIRNLAVVLAALKSSQEGRPVKLEELLAR
ncbi:MAG: Gfo/Idh/MocA family oxidoreductase [Armatimonadota bacterium]|nr:Gfo/Idh/MocA family oxidoreductase [Armatimonadota bacterium]